jgi:hypothetical protein
LEARKPGDGMGKDVSQNCHVKVADICMTLCRHHPPAMEGELVLWRRNYRRRQPERSNRRWFEWHAVIDLLAALASKLKCAKAYMPANYEYDPRRGPVQNAASERWQNVGMSQSGDPNHTYRNYEP